MRTSKQIILLSALILVLGMLASASGILVLDDGDPFEFTTVRGESVRVFGSGLYRYDSIVIASGNRGVDMVTLTVAVPLLLVSIVLYRRGSTKGQVLLTGMVAYFLYVYATLCLGTAYNDLFLVYVALFSASFYCLLLLLNSHELLHLATRLAQRVPGRGIAMFLFVTAFVATLAWAVSPVEAIVTGQPPDILGDNTTLVTHALDLAITVPALFVSGALILRKRSTGYLIAIPLLALVAMLAPAVTLMTVFQIRAGVELTPAEFAGYVIGHREPGVFCAVAHVCACAEGKTCMCDED